MLCSNDIALKTPRCDGLLLLRLPYIPLLGVPGYPDLLNIHPLIHHIKSLELCVNLRPSR